MLRIAVGGCGWEVQLPSPITLGNRAEILQDKNCDEPAQHPVPGTHIHTFLTMQRTYKYIYVSITVYTQP